MQITTVELAKYRAQLADIVTNLQQTLTASATNAGDYLPEAHYRQLYQQGRINDDDLTATFASLDQQTDAAKIAKLALLYDFPSLNNSQLQWQLHTHHALKQLQADVPATVASAFLAGENPAIAVPQLWASLLEKLTLTDADQHPETLLTCTETAGQASNVHQQTRQQAESEFKQLLSELGNGLSLRGWVLALSGTDSLDSVRPQLLRLYASARDNGYATWPLPDYQSLGLYAAWRAMVPYDANLFLHQLPDWKDIIAELPEQPLDNISLQLLRLAIPKPQWAGYLYCLVQELPEWTGLLNGQPVTEAALADYLAIRLTLDRLWLNQICHDLWKVEAKVSALETYFQKNLSEFLIRKRLYAGKLPEYLTELAEALIIRAGSERQCRSDWQQLADLLHTWQLNQSQHTASDSGWRLFRLCQHLGLNAAQLQALDSSDLTAMLASLDKFTANERCKIWHYAQQHHYQQTLLHEQPKPQPLIFCIDSQQENLRRHLQACNQQIRIVNAADFFTAASDNEHKQPWRQKAHWLWQRGLLQPMAIAYPAINLLAPLSLLNLIAKSLAPISFQTVSQKLTAMLLPAADLHHLSDTEQAELLAKFLSNIGLIVDFAQLVVFIDHTANDKAQAFATLANRPPVRQLLAARGIQIPDDCWFISASHNNDSIHWQDLTDLPESHRSQLKTLQADLLAVQTCKVDSN